MSRFRCVMMAGRALLVGGLLMVLPVSGQAAQVRALSLVVDGATGTKPAAEMGAVAPTPAEASCNVSKPKATNTCGPDGVPLRLEPAPIYLPTAVVGSTYRYTIKVGGGLFPYGFQLVDGTLPVGINLLPEGGIQGIAISRGRQRFVVEINDQSGQQIKQSYVLTVVPASGKAKVEEPAGKVPPLTTLSIADAQQPLPARRRIEPYMLTQKLLDSIEFKPVEVVVPVEGEPVPPPPVPEKDAMPDVLNEAGIVQLKQMLKSMVGVEYLNRQLFAAALDAQVCRYAEAITRKAALTTKQVPPSRDQWQKTCLGSWDRLAQHPTTVVVEASAPVPWQELGPTLVPLELRTWLIDQSRQTQKLAVVPKPMWLGSGCNCLVSATNGEVYAFYPNWHGSDKAPPIDFSLYERIITFGQPFDEDGNVAPMQPGPEQLAFFRAVHTYGSKHDVAIYRNDWQFLRTLPDDHQARIVRQVAKQSLRMIDTPLSDFGRRWHDWAPGIATDERIGDGITLYLDNLPRGDKLWREAFERFRHRLIQALIAEMRRSPRQYTLNLMINDVDMVSTEKPAITPADNGKGKPGSKSKESLDPDDADRMPRWSIDNLFDYLILAEDPRIQDGRIAQEAGGYKSRTNLTLRYVVLLSEPTHVSKSALRDFVEASPLLAGADRRIFLRKLFPMVSVGSATPPQFTDDMAHFMNNFGGVALWPQPELNKEVSDHVAHTLRTSFLANEPKESAVCGMVCEYRWPLRAIFAVLMIVGVLSFAAYFLSCRVRALGRPYQIYLLLGCLPPLILGGLLLQCDPSLLDLRDDNSLLFALIGILLISSIIPLLKPKVEAP
ncbi:Ig domain-containing protein [Chitinimonas naiadis]